MHEKDAANLFKALGDENRIRILKHLREGERCACKLLEEINISQPTLSHHMKILCDAGIVIGRKESRWMHYSISCSGAKEIRALLGELLSPEYFPANCCCEENEKDRR